MSTSEFISKTIRPEVRALKAYPVTPPWPGIKLELMEDAHLDAGPSTAAIRKEMAERVADSAFNRYPDPSAPALKAKLREKLGIAPQHDILTGTGSDEIITMLSQAILAGGGTVVSLEPSFAVFKNAALAVAGRYVGVSLKADFTLEAAPDADGLQWVLASPKTKDGQLKSVRVGFAGEQLAALDILDSFGQRSLIRFNGMQANAALPASTFQFKPPAGADLHKP